MHAALSKLQGAAVRPQPASAKLAHTSHTLLLRSGASASRRAIL
jgi:hypothetical protein